MLMYREYWYGSLCYIKEHESFFQLSYAFLILCETLNVYFIHTFKLRHCLVICVDQISIKTIDVPLWSMLTTAMLNQLQTSLKWLSPILVEITPVVQRRRFLNCHTPERHMKTDAKWWVRWAKNVKFSTKYLLKLKEIL